MFLRKDGALFPEKKSASRLIALPETTAITRDWQTVPRALLDTIECNTHVEQRVIRRIVGHVLQSISC